MAREQLPYGEGGRHVRKGVIARVSLSTRYHAHLDRISAISRLLLHVIRREVDRGELVIARLHPRHRSLHPYRVTPARYGRDTCRDTCRDIHAETHAEIYMPRYTAEIYRRDTSARPRLPPSIRSVSCHRHPQYCGRFVLVIQHDGCIRPSGRWVNCEIEPRLAWRST